MAIEWCRFLLILGFGVFRVTEDYSQHGAPTERRQCICVAPQGQKRQQNVAEITFLGAFFCILFAHQPVARVIFQFLYAEQTFQRCWRPLQTLGKHTLEQERGIDPPPWKWHLQAPRPPLSKPRKSTG